MPKEGWFGWADTWLASLPVSAGLLQVEEGRWLAMLTQKGNSQGMR